jgi:hypothetical protein
MTHVGKLKLVQEAIRIAIKPLESLLNGTPDAHERSGQEASLNAKRWPISTMLRFQQWEHTCMSQGCSLSTKWRHNSSNLFPPRRELKAAVYQLGKSPPTT